MNKTWIALALILMIAGQLIVLSSFHKVDGSGSSETNAVITVAKLSYVDARVTLSIFPMVSNGTSTVEIIFPNGTTINLTTTNGALPEIYTETFSFPRTGDSLGLTGEQLGNGLVSVSLSQDEPLTITTFFDVNDTNSYDLSRLSYSGNIDLYTFVIYGRAEISISGYGVAL